MAAVQKNKVKGAPRGGQSRRKKGDWIVIHNSRAHKDRYPIARANRDWPAQATGSAAYRRAHAR